MTTTSDFSSTTRRNGSTGLPRIEIDERDDASVQDRTLSHGAPAKPLLGVLPIARLIPQDIHSMMDYGNGALSLLNAVTTDCPKARLASIVLGAAGTGTSLMTDYRLSVAKVIPIEAHE